jgi:hypothetical protein
VVARNGRKHTLSFEICKKFFRKSVLQTRGWVSSGQVLTTWLAAGNWAKGPNLEGWGGKGTKREGSRAKRGQSYRDSEGNKAGPPTPTILQGMMGKNFGVNRFLSMPRMRGIGPGYRAGNKKAQALTRLGSPLTRQELIDKV